MPKSMYVHIPFCKTICSYCDFCKVFYNEKLASSYIDSLIYEIKKAKPQKCNTIYIGGGTPTALSSSLLVKLLSFLNNYLNKGAEFSIESNPENLDAKKVDILSKYNINRVSIGVQSFSNKTLNLLERNHTRKDIKKGVKILKNHNINNFSFDFIYGIEKEKKGRIKKDIKKGLKLKPNHLSFYSLYIEKHTKLYLKNKKVLSQDKTREQFDLIYKKLTKKGFKRYEISNFAKKGFVSKHNLTYWRNFPYYGFGSGASSYIDNKRETTHKNVFDYAYKKSFLKKEIVTIDNKDQKFYYLMLNLRLVDGFCLSEYKKIFKKDFLEEYKNNINRLKGKKLCIINKDKFSFSYDGLMLFNYSLLMLLEK